MPASKVRTAFCCVVDLVKRRPGVGPCTAGQARVSDFSLLTQHPPADNVLLATLDNDGIAFSASFKAEQPMPEAHVMQQLGYLAVLMAASATVASPKQWLARRKTLRLPPQLVDMIDRLVLDSEGCLPRTLAVFPSHSSPVPAAVPCDFELVPPKQALAAWARHASAARKVVLGVVLALLLGIAIGRLTASRGGGGVFHPGALHAELRQNVLQLERRCQHAQPQQETLAMQARMRELVMEQERLAAVANQWQHRALEAERTAAELHVHARAVGTELATCVGDVNRLRSKERANPSEADLLALVAQMESGSVMMQWQRRAQAAETQARALSAQLAEAKQQTVACMEQLRNVERAGPSVDLAAARAQLESVTGVARQWQRRAQEAEAQIKALSAHLAEAKERAEQLRLNVQVRHSDHQACANELYRSNQDRARLTKNVAGTSGAARLLVLLTCSAEHESSLAHALQQLDAANRQLAHLRGTRR